MSRTPALARSHVAPRAICISRLAGRPAVVRETEGRFLEEDEYKVPLRSPQHPPISSRHHPERALPAPPKHIRQQQQPTTTATTATASRMLLPIPLLLFALLAPATSSPLADADADADAAQWVWVVDKDDNGRVSRRKSHGVMYVPLTDRKEFV